MSRRRTAGAGRTVAGHTLKDVPEHPPMNQNNVVPKAEKTALSPALVLIRHCDGLFERVNNLERLAKPKSVKPRDRTAGRGICRYDSIGRDLR